MIFGTLFSSFTHAVNLYDKSCYYLLIFLIKIQSKQTAKAKGGNNTWSMATIFLHLRCTFQIDPHSCTSHLPQRLRAF